MRVSLVSFGCLFFFSATLLAGGIDGPSKEPIILESLQRDMITFKAKSHGCSHVNDFRIEQEGRDVSIYRIKPDRCRRMPFWDKFSLPLSLDVRDNQIYILNPLVLHSD